VAYASALGMLGGILALMDSYLAASDSKREHETLWSKFKLAGRVFRTLQGVSQKNTLSIERISLDRVKETLNQLYRNEYREHPLLRDCRSFYSDLSTLNQRSMCHEHA
jgi:hypothetical protein